MRIFNVKNFSFIIAIVINIVASYGLVNSCGSRISIFRLLLYVGNDYKVEGHVH